jgi:hypothetical protein
MPYVIDDAFRKRLDRLACKTVLGQVIDSDSEAEGYRLDETYPLRFHLRQLSRYIWYDLLKEGKREENILRAVDVVKREFANYLSPSAMEYGDVHSKKGDDGAAMNLPTILQVRASPREMEWLAVHRDKQREIRGMDESEVEAPVPPLGKWYIHTDPTIGLELVEDDWLQNKELWQVEEDWTWAHVYDFLALLTIDSALSNAMRGQPFKAAVTAARASEYHGTATALRSAQTAEAAAVSSLGKRGSDVRHSSNRAAKDEAIHLYLAKTTWTSLAQAARVIGAKVNKTERVVEKWIREYRKCTSSGTVTS